MSDILALDIETANFSHEIGGWKNTHLFEPSVVATWDGNDGTIYCNKGLDVDNTVKALHPKTLGEDLAEHVEKVVKSLDTISRASTYLYCVMLSTVGQPAT